MPRSVGASVGMVFFLMRAGFQASFTRFPVPLRSARCSPSFAISPRRIVPPSSTMADALLRNGDAFTATPLEKDHA